jgi:hypothetical protein
VRLENVFGGKYFSTSKNACVLAETVVSKLSLLQLLLSCCIPFSIVSLVSGAIKAV